MAETLESMVTWLGVRHRVGDKGIGSTRHGGPWFKGACSEAVTLDPENQPGGKRPRDRKQDCPRCFPGDAA
jgi:hypothetical protein